MTADLGVKGQSLPEDARPNRTGQKGAITQTSGQGTGLSHIGRRAACVTRGAIVLRAEHEPVRDRFIEALAFYDTPTALHSSRVAEFSYRLADAAGLPRHQVEELALAGYLHDLGKMDIPVSILAKPGRLDADEWAIVKRHPEVGANLLVEAHPEMGEVAEAILAHHERPDGLGYPRAVRGDAIPVGGRVLAISDVFDAITTPRAYRPGAADAEQARQYLHSQRGKQFDADLVGIFLSLEGLPAN